MPWQPTVDYAPFAPDQSPLGMPVSNEILNVVPQADGYGPFKSLSELTKALPSKCRGYKFARRSDGTIAVFAGTSTRLYLLDNATLAWIDVSKGGASYGDLVASDNWQFEQFNDFVIAVQVNTPPQKFVLSSGTAFVDLGGSPPAAGAIAVINRIIVLTNLLSEPRRAQWCDLGAPEVWTAGVGTADYEDFPDGGVVNGVAGGDAFGAVFQDDCVRSLTYAPGSSTTFQIRKIAVQESLFARYSIVAAAGRIFYSSAQGFKMIVGADAQPQPIGKEFVDRTFFKSVDRNNLQLMIGATDPSTTRVYMAYKSNSGADGLFDNVLAYDWSMPAGRQWSLLSISGEYIASLAKPGLTLEQLDAIAPTPLNVVNATNNGAGSIRLTLNTTNNGDFSIAGQNFIVVYGVEGTVEANGTWVPLIIDGTHIDLVGSTFVNAYTGNGHIGGALANLGFSLDSVSKGSVAALSAFSSNHKAGFFDGPNLEAILETPDADGTGWNFFVSGLRPITDSVDVMCSVGMRKRAQDTPTYSDESAINEDGFCPQLVETRYPRIRSRYPAGKVWSYAKGVQALGEKAGDT